jgi:hypothetical protein
MKKIEIRKTGDVRLTSHANPLYGGVVVAAAHPALTTVCG